MEKDDVANLIVKKSDRIMFKTHKDKSEAWKWFVKIVIDNKVCDFMKCKLELADGIRQLTNSKQTIAVNSTQCYMPVKAQLIVTRRVQSVRYSCKPG